MVHPRARASVKIALAHPYVWPRVRRGAERYAADLAGWLTARGHDVDLVAGPNEQADPAVAGRVVTTPFPPALQAWLQRHRVSEVDSFGLTTWPTLRRGRYDVVHAFVPSAAVAARLAGRPTVFTAMGHPAPELIGRRLLDRPIFWAAVRAAHVRAGLSDASARAFEELTGRPAMTLAPGVRLADFPLRPAPAAGPPRVLFSGDLGVARKGLDTLLSAWPAVLRRHPDARLWLSGPGDPSWARSAAPSWESVDELGVGTPADVVTRYTEATVTALPADGEAFGLVLLESLACGTPVVCADRGGPPEIVREDVGRVAPYGDPDRLAAALLDAIALAGLDATPGRCRDRAALWDWSVVGPRHEQVYAGVVRRS
jgi:phosphatidylinositol alpha-mannosyltransferase